MSFFKDPAEATRERAFLSDADRQEMIDRLTTATPAQIKTYVNNNVTNLAGAKTLLAQLMLVLATLARR